MNDHTRDAVAKRLATAHYRVDAAIQKIRRVMHRDLIRENDDYEPIKLLEVNGETPKQGIVPVSFGPNAQSGIDFPSTIIEVHPDEYEKIVQGALSLPDEWELGDEFDKADALQTV